jgi:hypothetical protein
MTKESSCAPLDLIEMPCLAGEIKFDSEGSMFCAYAKDEAALRRLAELLRDAVHDHARLRRYLDAGDPDRFD